jgi:undecaprenyl-diphosphatase
MLLLVAALAGSFWAFAEVTEKVLEGRAGFIDHSVLLALRAPGEQPAPIGPAWVQAMARDVTAMGSAVVLGSTTAAVAGFLLLAGRARTALFVVLSTLSGTLTMLLLKEGFDRPRPSLLTQGDHAMAASFPSGHAMVSTLVYLTLAALLTRLLPTPALKLYVLAAALLLSVAIGLSRIYLGMHWPTDVMAGWAAGAAWALASRTLVEYLAFRQRLQA